MLRLNDDLRSICPGTANTPNMINTVLDFVLQGHQLISLKLFEVTRVSREWINRISTNEVGKRKGCDHGYPKFRQNMIRHKFSKHHFLHLQNGKTLFRRRFITMNVILV